MSANLIAYSSITINVPVATVWDALINPSIVKLYMFGTQVISEWKEGTPIIWKGIWQGKPYEDRGMILKIVPEKTLQYTHFSPLSGAADIAENYHTVTYELSDTGEHTQVLLSQDKNETEEELTHSQKMWDTVLAGLKMLLEKNE